MPAPIRIAGLTALTLTLACGSGDSGAMSEKGVTAESAAAYAAAVEAFDRRGGRDDAEAAVESFQQAVELDPSNAPAWAGLAQAQAWMLQNFGETDALDEAENAVAQAEALAPDAVETHVARGYVAYWGRRDFDSALAEFKAAEGIESDDPDVLGAIGNIYRRKGELDDAIEYYQRRIELDPDMPLGLVTLAQTYDRAGRYSDEADVAARLRAMDDDRGINWAFWAHLNAGDSASAFALVPEIRAAQGEPGYFDMIQAVLRRDDEAAMALADTIGYDVGGGLRAEISQLLARTDQVESHADAFEGWIADLSDGLDIETPSESWAALRESAIRSQLAWLQALQGNEAEARRNAARVLELRPEVTDVWAGNGHLYDVAMAYAVLGDNDAALTIFERLAQGGGGFSSGWLEYHPSFDPLRGEPRFYEIRDAVEAMEQAPD